MKLLPAWNERLQELELEPVPRSVEYGLKKSARYYSAKTNFVDTLDGAQSMLDFAMQRPFSHIGFDTEFRYDRPGVVVDKRNTANDPRSIRPLLLSLSMAEPHDNGEGRLFNFVIDLRIPELLPALKRLFQLPVCFGRSLYKGGDLLFVETRSAGAEHPLGYLRFRKSSTDGA